MTTTTITLNTVNMPIASRLCAALIWNVAVQVGDKYSNLDRSSRTTTHRTEKDFR